MENILKRLIFFIILSILTFDIIALGTLRVESIQELPVEHMNLEVYDADGKFAPMLIVKTDLKGLGIQNIGRPTKHAPEYNSGDHQYEFYTNDKQRVVKITHSDYKALEVRLLADFDINVKAQRVYELVLTDIPEKVFVTIIIETDPSDADKWIDGEKLDTGQNISIETGEHTLEISKNGYESIRSEKINVNEDNIYFKYKLNKAEDVKLIINTKPIGAEVYIDDVKLRGTTPIRDFFDAGRHRIKILKDKYLIYEDDIEIVSPTTEEEYTLQPDFGTIIISTDSDIEMEIYLNDISKGKTPIILKEMPAIEYDLKLEHDDDLYTAKSELFTLNRGEEKEIILHPQQKFCTVNVSCEPKIEMKIYFDDDYKGKVGANDLKLEPVSPGEHIIRAEHEKDLYTANSFPLDLERGEVNNIVFKPQINYGTIDISCKPNEEMEIYLNDVLYGKTPITLNEVISGEYTIKAKHDLYSVAPQPIVLGRGENKKIILEPQSNFGSLILSSNPEVNLKIYLDGNYQGETPLTISPIFEGEHQVTAEHEYYKADPYSFTIKSDQQINNEIVAHQNFGTITITTSSGSKVYLNDKLVTKYDKIKLNPTTIELRAEKNKCESVEEQFILKAGDQRTVELVPKPITGTILVTANPTNAKIELTGDAGEYFSGEGFENFNYIPYGKYTLRITKENYISYEEKINLKKDDEIRRDEDLQKVNYIFHFDVSSGIYNVEELNFKITKNNEEVYTGKGKKQISFSEKGTYGIEVTKGTGFAFTKSLKVDMNKKDYYIYIVNFIALEKEKIRTEKEKKEEEKNVELRRKQREKEIKKTRKLEANKKLAGKMYDTGEENELQTFDSIVGVLGIFVPHDERPAGFFGTLNYLFLESKDCLQASLFAKFHSFNPKIIDERFYSFYYGFSLLGNCMYSPELAMIDVLSFNAGLVLSTYNHKNRLLFDIDGGGKYAFGYNLTCYNERITFIKKIEIENDELHVNKTNFGGWVPADISISFERHIGGLSFIILKAGILVTTDEGSDPDAKWYIKDVVDNWQSGDPLPISIDKVPDHPIYQEIVPYFGFGIRF